MAIDDTFDWDAGFTKWAVGSRVRLVIRNIFGAEDRINLLTMDFVSSRENRRYSNDFTAVVFDTLERGL